jgi:galactosamine-6-phosphate isomerase
MKIAYFDDYTGMSAAASRIVINSIRSNPGLLICAPTGGSPTGLYANLAREFSLNSSLFEKLNILKLDEWGGIPMNDPNSCHSYLLKHVITPLKIDSGRYFGFNNEAKDPEAECLRVQKEIDTRGPADICILGLGKNGHLGLNEPAEFLHRDCHIASLSKSTLGHSMAQAMPGKPTFGMTVGIGGIMSSKKIIMLITGKDKQESIKRMLNGEITTLLPASMLWLHPDVECLIDKTSC